MLRKVFLASAGALVLGSPAAASVDPLKSVTDALWAALKGAKPGDVVKAGPGPYGVLNVPGAVAPGVTLTSADPANPAHLAGINMNAQTGITLSHLDIAGAVTVGNSKQITLQALTIRGPSEPIGVLFRNDTTVSLTDSDITGVGVGVAVIDTLDATVSRNAIHNTSADAIDLFGSSKLVITSNKISDITMPPGGHPDGIQFAGTALHPASDDILVSGNDLRTGSGKPYQGIFGGGDAAHPYTNVRVTDNLVMADMWNGIALGGMIAPVISGNYVQAHAGVVDAHGQAMGPWIMLRGTQGGTIVDNVAPSVSIVAPIGVSPTVKRNRVPKLAPDGAYAEAEAWRAARRGGDADKSIPDAR